VSVYYVYVSGHELLNTNTQAYAGTLVDQLNRNSASYLPGGELHNLFVVEKDNPDLEIRRSHARQNPTTADDMERVFGVFKYCVDVNPNLGLTTASSMTCYR